MAHFMIAHLQGGEYNGQRILSAATAAQMHNSPLTVIPPLNRMELGFFETNINGHEVIAHLGDTDSFHTSLHLYLQEGVGFYVSFNSLGKDGAAGKLRNALFFDFSDRYFPARPPDTRVDAATAKAHAAALAGSWANSRSSKSNFLAALDLVSQTHLGVNDKGELVTPPFPGLNGEPRHWIEYEPFVWRDRDSHERLAAKVVDGKAVRFSIDELSPFIVFDRASWYQDTSWLLLVFIASVSALLLTAIFWPISAIVRKRYGAALNLDNASLRAYRMSKIGAVAILTAIAAWGLTIGAMLSDFNDLSTRFDSILYCTQALGIIGFIGGFILILRNLNTVWAGQRRWPALVWSIVLALSAFFVLWVAFVFKLIRMGANY